MTNHVRISSVFAGLLLIVFLGGAWVDVNAQATTGQKLNADGAAALQRIPWDS